MARNLTATAPGRQLDHPLPGDGTDPEVMLVIWARLAPFVDDSWTWYTTPVRPRR